MRGKEGQVNCAGAIQQDILAARLSTIGAQIMRPF